MTPYNNIVYVRNHEGSTVQIPGKSVVKITYSGTTFQVTKSDLNSLFTVSSENLVGDFRNSGEVVSQILMVLNCTGDSQVVSIDAAARAEIDRIWEMNIVLFPNNEHI